MGKTFEPFQHIYRSLILEYRAVGWAKLFPISGLGPSVVEGAVRCFAMAARAIDSCIIVTNLFALRDEAPVMEACYQKLMQDVLRDCEHAYSALYSPAVRVCTG